MLMTQRDRRRAAMRHAFRYQPYKDEVTAYVDSCLALSAPKERIGGSASGHRSDPTARAGIKLAEMPESIRMKALWIRAVNDAWSECAEDDGDLAYLFEKNFRLTGNTLGPEHNTEVRNEIIEHLRISTSTFYERLEAVTDILVYHATKRKLL